MSYSDSVIGKCKCGGDIILVRQGSTFDPPFCDKCKKEYSEEEIENILKKGD